MRVREGETDGGREDQYPLGSSFLCPLALVVDTAEVRHYHRNGQGDDQHPTQRAYGSKHLPHDCFWHHVAVTGTQRADNNALTRI